MELEAERVGEGMKSRGIGLGVSGSCCLGVGGGSEPELSDTLSSRQATTDMTYCSFIPFTALRKWRGTGDSLRSGHQLTGPNRRCC